MVKWQNTPENENILQIDREGKNFPNYIQRNDN